VGYIATALRGTANVAAVAGNAICPLGSAPTAMIVQNTTGNTSVGRMQLNCATLGNNSAGASSLTAAGASAIIGPATTGALSMQACAAGQVATGLEIRAGAVVQQVGLRCTPITSL
jgi:hypothetical protein